MITHDETNESHRAGCAECRALWAELEAIAAEARALPVLTPNRDLWQGIEARLGGTPASASAPKLEQRTTRPSIADVRATRRWFATPAVRYAAATALLMAGTAAVTWRIAGDRAAASAATGTAVTATTDGERGAGAPATTAGAAVLGTDEAVRLRTASSDADFLAMDREIETMQRLLDARRETLDTTTVRVLETNLRVIDAAIAESRAALARDPASQFLAVRLARSYTTKLTLLRSTATMPVGL